MNEFIGSVWWLVVTLGLLITFHEYGHFVVARHFGVKVLRFSVGFGKPLWSRRDRHGTEFAIAAIPLGGYVKMLDEREGNVDDAQLAGAFNRKPVLQRMAIAAAGPAFNLIFTVAALWLMLVIGKPDYQPVIDVPTGLAASAQFAAGDRIVAVDGEAVETWTGAIDGIVHALVAGRSSTVEVRTASGGQASRVLPLAQLSDSQPDQAFAQIGLRLQRPSVAPVAEKVAAGMPAESAGMRAGDRIISINGTPISDYADITPAIAEHVQVSPLLKTVVDRDGERLTLDITAQQLTPDDGAPRWVIGVTAPPISHDAVLRSGPLAAVPGALSETWRQTRSIFGLIGQMITGNASTRNLSGIITIAQVANSSAQMGAAWFLNFLALISLSLAIMNLLPIPVLDGGHLLYYLIELVKGSPVSERTQIAGQFVGMMMLVALMGLAIYNDILRLAS